eukprot:CAMPEP_0179159196 /NCGR_PEP_ID=MMETSP0796-20121207/77731_1 /TAXON_ID=73915 /ORGANISM="Pyrodinium bahamense, Strain pbaha01" /LENGTH=79 /DNA_ID=CAMNT_0020860951 /DNA_START=51 /DNA_END=287 /DNA_ORIENTATION=-
MTGLLPIGSKVEIVACNPCYGGTKELRELLRLESKAMLICMPEDRGITGTVTGSTNYRGHGLVFGIRCDNGKEFVVGPN